VKQPAFLILLILLLFSACTNKVEEKKAEPVDLIPKDQMVDIMVDLRLMDAILASKQRNKEQDLNDSKVFLYNSIMQKYGITRDRFERSLQYYQYNLKVLDELDEQAITKLSKLKTEEEQD
jgi:hypothetical protein